MALRCGDRSARCRIQLPMLMSGDPILDGALLAMAPEPASLGNRLRRRSSIAAKAHRAMAIDANNSTWDLLDGQNSSTDLTPADIDEVLTRDPRRRLPLGVAA